METFVTAVILLLFIFMAVSQIVRNRKIKDMLDWKMKTAPAVLISSASVLAAVLAASDFSPSSCLLMVSMMPAAMAMWLMLSSFSEGRLGRYAVVVLLVMNLLLFLYHLRCIWKGFMPMPELNIPALALSMTALFIFVIIYGLWKRIYDVKSIIRGGGTWTIVCMSVDSIYVIFFVFAAMLVQSGFGFIGVLLIAGNVAALDFRMMEDAKFLLWRSQERLIVESMKSISVVGLPGESRMDLVYKDLYERIVDYFEDKKPYLDSELTINTLVKTLYSNKLYISRSICLFTGRNFCQFVNYYRVLHSISIFRANTDLKVHELANFSGFNSVVSYNMAFRLFMGMNPSEWCRMERSRILKGRKEEVVNEI